MKVKNGYLYRIIGIWNHVDLSGTTWYDPETAVFPYPVFREGLLKYAEDWEVEAIIRDISEEVGPLDEEDCQGIGQRCQRSGLWTTREQVKALLKP